MCLCVSASTAGCLHIYADLASMCLLWPSEDLAGFHVCDSPCCFSSQAVFTSDGTAFIPRNEMCNMKNRTSLPRVVVHLILFILKSWNVDYSEKCSLGYLVFYCTLYNKEPFSSFLFFLLLHPHCDTDLDFTFPFPISFQQM